MKKIIPILLIVIWSNQLFAQQRSITGHVVSEKDGSPLQGASISFKETVIAVSDYEGFFQFNSNDNIQELKITNLGYKPYKLKLEHGKWNNYLIPMEEEIHTLADVIVSSGYQQIPKDRSTGSFEKINKELFERVVTPNILMRLDGIASGLYYSKVNGKDGINIRGLSTITGNTQPLIVLDNFPYEGDIKNINVNDIESITLLKDAAAASIWGARSANGVIVITSKKARLKQPLSVNFNTSVSIQGKPQLMKETRLLETVDQVSVERFLFEKGFYNSHLSNNTSRPLVSPVVEILNQLKYGIIDETVANEKLSALSSIDVRNEYLKHLYRKGVKQQYYVSLLNAGSNFSNSFSVGFDRDISSAIGNVSNRFSLRNGTDIRINDRLDVQLEIRYSFGKDKLNFIDPSSDAKIYRYTRFTDVNGIPAAIDKDYRSSYLDTAGKGLLLDWKYRPLDELKYADNRLNSNDLLLRFGVNYRFNKTLGLSLNGQAEKSDEINRKYYSLNTYYARNLVNRYSQVEDEKVKHIVPLGGILDVNNVQLNSWAARVQLTYDKAWSRGGEVNMIVGGEARETVSSSEAYRTYGFNDDNLNFSSMDYLNRYPVYGNLSSPSLIPGGPANFTAYTNRLVSLYLNAGYLLKKRYSVSVSARKDASNLFGVTANNRWSPFWSVGSAWDIFKENFFKVPSVSYLKLRLTYGFNGNINNNVAGIPTIALLSGSSQITGLPGASVRNLANRDLRWERSGILNTGVDFAIFNNKINGSVEFYKKRSIDLISPTSVDETSGISLMQMNVANLSTTGWDLTLEFLPVNKKVQWKSRVLFSHVKNIVTKYFNESANKSSFINFGNRITPREGEDPYALTSYRFAGLDSVGDPIGYFQGVGSKNYSSIIRTPTWDDLVIHGSSRPVWFGNFINSITWRNFTVSANISFKLGYYFRRYSIDYSSLFSQGIGHIDYYSRWQKPGDEFRTSVPSLIYPVNNNRETYYKNSETTVSKADNIRIQDISISYAFPAGKASIGVLKEMRIYCYVTNLGILWASNRYGLDPDFGITVPPPFILSLGLRKAF